MEDSYVLQLLKPKFKDFHLCFCGFAECKPLHSYGPAARPNYILHYVMKGKGIYQVGETKYQLYGGTEICQRSRIEQSSAYMRV